MIGLLASPMARAMIGLLVVGGIVAAEEVRIAWAHKQLADARAELAGYAVAVERQSDYARRLHDDAAAARRSAASAARKALTGARPAPAKGTGPGAMNSWLQDTLSPSSPR